MKIVQMLILCFYRQVNETKLDQFNKIYKVVYPENRAGWMTRYKYFSHLFEFGLAVASKTLSSPSVWQKLLNVCWYGPLYAISTSRRQAEFKNFVSSGDLEVMLKLAKASGNDVSKLAFYFINPRIKVHQKLYIPHNYEKLTITELNKCLEDYVLKNTDNTDDEDYRFTKKLRGAESFSYKIENKLQAYANKHTFKYAPKKGFKNMVRLVAPFPVSFNNDPHKQNKNIRE